MNDKELQILKDAYDLIGGLIGDSTGKKLQVDDLPEVMDALGGDREK